MTKSVNQAMTLEEIPMTKSKNLGKKTAVKMAEQLNTSTLAWIVIKRHKMGIVLTWAITLTVVQLFPFVPTLIVDVLTSL